MCGILCLIQFAGKPVDSDLAKKCLDELRPRGPDKNASRSIRVNENVDLLMGFARLAIMDTSDAGLQPFSNDIGSYVVCNGEIYNYQALAREHNISLKTECDCEILLPLFEKMGFLNMIRDELDGEFATVVYDGKTNKIYAARDRFGVRPLYYGYNKTTRTVGFASELKALHPAMEFVEQVSPNQILCIDLNEDDMDTLIKSQEYYRYEKMIANIKLDNVDYIQEQLNYYLTIAVKKRLHADRPIGFLLSGGLDSSLIVAIATKILGPDNVVCFSIGMEGSPDVEAAKKVVQFLGIKHHHIVPFSVEIGLSVLPEVIKTIETYDITTIRASVAQYVLAKFINENTDIRVILSGEGSDEISGSYRYFRDAPDMVQFHWETIRLLSELCYFDNQRTDRTMAGNGLEVRVPFLDFDYVEFITRINPSLLMYREDYIEKKIVRDSFKGYLPDEILYRSKEAFSDAVSSNEVNWAQSIQLLSHEKISDEELENNPFVTNKPRTKDALYFRRIFDSIYPGRDNIIPHYWLPRFQKEEVLDPSARVLKSY